MAVVVLWNLEEFGTRYGTTMNSVDGLRAGLVAAILQDMNADVLVIQEYRKGGLEDLRLLKSALNGYQNGSWDYDWIPGAILDNWTGDVNNLPKLKNLGYTQSANNEGYAVLWRNNILLQIPNAPSARKNGNYITLAFKGKKVKFVDTEPVIRTGTKTNNYIMGFTLPSCEVANIKTKRELRSVAITYTSNLQVNQTYSSRRPALITINDSNNNKCFILSYHAPNGSPACYYGPLLGLLSEFFDSGNCVLAGDWNIIDSKEREYVLKGAELLSCYGPDIMCTNSANTEPATMVHSYHYIGNKYFWSITNDDIYTNHRDVGFSKTTNKSMAMRIWDPCKYLANRNSMSRKYVADNGTQLLSEIQKQKDNLFFPDIIYVDKKASLSASPGDYVVNANTFNNNYPQNGYNKDVGRAIIYEAFVSDHLPIVLTI